MPRRPLSSPATTALEIIFESGAREMRAHDLELRMHQRGFDARALAYALKAFERRSWLIQTGSTIQISDAAFCVAPKVPKKRPASKRVHARLPRGLFAG